MMGIFTNIVIFWFIKKYSSRPFLAVLFYFLTLFPLLTFEALRESLSVTFYILALDALISGKGLKTYYLRVWPAIFFHSFGFMTLAFPLIQLLKPNKLTVVITIAASIFILLLGYSVGDYVMLYVDLSSNVGDKMDMYLNSDVYGQNQWSIGGILAILLGYVFPISIMANIARKFSDERKWLYSYMMFMIMVSLFKINLPIFYRFFNYFYIVLIIGLTESLSTERERFNFNLKILAHVSVFLFIFMVLYSLSKPVGSSKIPAFYRYYPYNSIITKDINPNTEKVLPL